MPAGVVPRVSDAERPSAVAVLPLLEPAPLRRDPAAPPRGQSEPAQLPMDPVESRDVAMDLFAEPQARENLMAGVAVNFDVIDRALEMTLDEIEQMGGDFVAWLEASRTRSTLVSAGAALLLAGGGSYYWSRRRVAQLAGKDEEEPSSWLFTHLYIPSVRT